MPTDDVPRRPAGPGIAAYPWPVEAGVVRIVVEDLPPAKLGPGAGMGD